MDEPRDRASLLTLLVSDCTCPTPRPEGAADSQCPAHGLDVFLASVLTNEGGAAE